MADPELDAEQPEPEQPEPVATPEPVAEWESEGGAVLPPGLPLTLRGPDGAGPDELDAALVAARRALPEGYRLERD
ncbi:MAG TPA: hypothetical protein VFP83_03380 [Candidatus Limnocylindria bacterium]|nr:hypothetical protein [Candidatus Limnocylindria bacterium]